MRAEFLLRDCEEEKSDAEKHQQTDGEKKWKIIRGYAAAHQKFDHDEGVNAAHCAHQINDGIPFTAKGLRCQIRHQRNGRRTVQPHGDQDKEQRYDKENQAFLLVCCRQEQKEDESKSGSGQNERHSSADSCAGLIGEGAKQRK